MGALAGVFVGASAASAACTVPNQLTNGQTADASQVMANFNAVANCVTAAPGGATNSVQINGGGGFSGVGPLQDGQLVIGASSGAPVPAYLTAGSGITITNAPGSITVTATTSPGSGASGAPEGRLTLKTGTPVMSVDVTGSTSVYYDCYVGKGVPYYNGSVDLWGSIGGCEISTTFPATGTGALNAGDVFDVFFDGVHICVATNGAGAGWSGDTGGSTMARGTGYSSVQNVRGYETNAKRLVNCYNGATNEGAIGINQATYLGSFFTTAASATSFQMSPTDAAGGTAPCLCLWNAYNRVRVGSTSRDNTPSWTYATAAWRPADNSVLNRVSWVQGLPFEAAQAFAQFNINDFNGQCNSPAGGINVDSTTATPNRSAVQNSCNYGNWSVSIPGYMIPPMIGLHFVQAMEVGGANVTFYGTPTGGVVGIDTAY